MPGADQTLRAADGLAWHQALAYALLGRVEPSLGNQERPDLAVLVSQLDGLFPGGRSALHAEVAHVRRSEADRGWPLVVPVELRTGLGPAQYIAALTELRRRLDLGAGPVRTLSDRLPDSDEQTLLRDVPPHHGV